MLKNSKKQENKKHIRISIKESEKTVLNKIVIVITDRYLINSFIFVIFTSFLCHFKIHTIDPKNYSFVALL